MNPHTITMNVGSAGRGKTELTKRLILWPDHKRVLIVDTVNEYQDIPKINLAYKRDSFMRNSNAEGVMRICPHDYSDSVEERTGVIIDVVSMFNNGTLVLESIDYQYNLQDNSFFWALLATNKTFKREIIFNMQSLKKAMHPKIISNVDYINLFKTSESLDAIKEMPSFKAHMSSEYRSNEFKNAFKMVDKKYWKEDEKHYYYRIIMNK